LLSRSRPRGLHRGGRRRRRNPRQVHKDRRNQDAVEKHAALIAGVRHQQAKDPRAVLLRREAAALLGIGETALIQLERSGEVHSYLDVGVRRITAASAHDHMVRRAFASLDDDGVGLKRMPVNIFTAAERPKRPLSPRRRAALAAANERRRLEAQARREGAAKPPRQSAI
jgi:hypothetical protein